MAEEKRTKEFEQLARRQIHRLLQDAKDKYELKEITKEEYEELKKKLSASLRTL